MIEVDPAATCIKDGRKCRRAGRPEDARAKEESRDGATFETASRFQTNDRMEQVSALLGHQSLRVTERHYAPWVRARQEQLEVSVRRSWALDPVVSEATKGTHEVHGKIARVN